jgi:hypothetical protein
LASRAFSASTTISIRSTSSCSSVTTNRMVRFLRSSLLRVFFESIRRPHMYEQKLSDDLRDSGTSFATLDLLRVRMRLIDEA